jgi:hypothetical protein
VPFSRLTLRGQIEVLSHSPEISWSRCAGLNPRLESWRPAARVGGLEPAHWPADAGKWIGAAAAAERLSRLVRRVTTEPPPSSDPVGLQDELARFCLHPRRLYPLLWSADS